MPHLIKKTTYRLLIIACLMLMMINLKAQQKIDFNSCKNCLVLADQGVNRVAILDLDQKKVIWEWVSEQEVKPAHLKWYNYTSEAKPVYNGKYILTTASGGAVTLIRIADKKVMFYAYAGGNTHSAEILPDGNIVSSSSTGNYMTIFRVDTLHQPTQVYKKNISLANGHNVVWDKKRKLLWSASNRQLKAFKYNFNKNEPDLQLVDSVALPETDTHDLFAAYDQQSLWFSNPKGLYQYELKTRKISKIPINYPDIKSVSTGPKGYPTILIYAANTQKSWVTDQISSLEQKLLYQQSDLKMYKARWFVANEFSYPKGDDFKIALK
jgi:hypothetical protein